MDSQDRLLLVLGDEAVHAWLDSYQVPEQGRHAHTPTEGLDQRLFFPLPYHSVYWHRMIGAGNETGMVRW